MRDELFIRGSLPMTKSEVRAVSLSKLDLGRGALFWDIGAGTGSVSIEGAAFLNRMGGDEPGGGVYAIEKEEEGIRLIEENRKRFIPDASQFHIIKGCAPEALEGLPAPTHVFIGGSGGRLREILEVIWEKNPEARIVVNAVTAETFTACMEIVKSGMVTFYEVVQIMVSRMENIGPYHMQRGENPVFVITLQGKRKRVGMVAGE